MSERRTFVGFGFGPIQVGLYLFEAMQTGAFDRLVVGYRRPEVIERVRRAGGRIWLNIAHEHGIEHALVGPIDIYDVGDPDDREALIDAVADAGEVSTALSSVDDFAADTPGSVHRLLAHGLAKRARGGGRTVVYASENHTRAAAILATSVASALEPGERQQVEQQVAFVDTVIGKMCRTVDDRSEIDALGLRTRTDGGSSAYLVEGFREILIARTRGFDRALDCFVEKDDLEPFEEAKLYGHNATHAVAAYLGRECGVERIADVTDVPGFMRFLRAAALDESGAALRRRHEGKDPMFTADGYAAFTEQLIDRMLNPHLNDTVARVGRDPLRKLGWGDRLVGTMRLALAEGVDPDRHALAAAAALDAAGVQIDDLAKAWAAAEAPAAERREVGVRIARAQTLLERWRTAGRPPLESFLSATRRGYP